jgi:hypothetical protein
MPGPYEWVVVAIVIAKWRNWIFDRQIRF